jgi:hypothetical protein
VRNFTREQPRKPTEARYSAYNQQAAGRHADNMHIVEERREAGAGR